MAKTCRMLRDHGRKEKYEHELVGYNLRFNEIQGAVGRLQLRKLDWFNESRRQHCSMVQRWIEGIPVVTPGSKDWAEPVFHLYVIQTPQRENLADFLKEKGVQIGDPLSHSQPSAASCPECPRPAAETRKNRRGGARRSSPFPSTRNLKKRRWILSAPRSGSSFTKENKGGIWIDLPERRTIRLIFPLSCRSIMKRRIFRF